MEDKTTNPTPETAEDQTRAAVQQVAPTTTPAAATATETRTAADIAKDERNRIRRIQDLARMANVSDSVVNGLVERGVSVEEAQDEITRKWAAASAPAQDGRTPQAAVTGEAEEVTRAAAMENAILHRSGVAGVELRDDAKQYRSMRLLDMAREFLTARGVSVRGVSDNQVVGMAMRRGAYGAHSTSDFVHILGNTVNRSLQAAYMEAPRTFQAFTRQTTANDFRAKTITKLSGLVGAFEEIPEGGEYKAGKFTDSAESYALKTYGKKISITRQALINDDLGAFSRIPQAIANEAAQLQSDLVYGILTGNPLMSDGVALFATAHANQAASGTALSTTSLSAARATFRKQTGENGRFLNLTPQYLIVGPDLEGTALAILNGQMVADSVGNVNIWRGALTLVVDPRLGSAWYLSASPGTIDTIEYAFLNGAGELYTESVEGFDVDGMQVKARMDFATKAIDWRGLYKNAGA
jgi:phage major head subunit gpT-like protein